MQPVKEISPILPETPDEISEFLIKAANYMAYFEENYLLPLKEELSAIKAQKKFIKTDAELRRNRFLATDFDKIPKEYLKSVSLMHTYIDYNVYVTETSDDRKELEELEVKEVSLLASISKCELILSQYERAIKTGTMKLSYEKAHMVNLRR